jgi:hypothetical protein
MRETVTVTWRGAAAYYTLHDNRYQVYELALDRYEGGPADAPPAFLLLIKNGDRWIASLEEPALTDALGRSIECSRA